MPVLRSLVTIILFTPVFLQAQQMDRFQELFIWKMSEALKLDAEKEEAFTAAVRSLNDKKIRAMQEVDKTLSKMKEVKNESSAKVQINKYREALRTYQNVSQEELEILSRIFNYSQLARYLTIKTEIMKRLQEKILDPSAVESKKEIGPRKPKIILDE